MRHVPNAEESQGQNTFPSVLGLELPPLTPQLLVRSATPNGVVGGGGRNKNQQQQWHIPPDPVSANANTYMNMRASLLHTHECTFYWSRMAGCIKIYALTLSVLGCVVCVLCRVTCQVGSEHGAHS